MLPLSFEIILESNFKLSIITLPVAFGVRFIFPLLAVDAIVSLSMVNSSTITFPTLSSDQFKSDVPNL